MKYNLDTKELEGTTQEMKEYLRGEKKVSKPTNTGLFKDFPVSTSGSSVPKKSFYSRKRRCKPWSQEEDDKIRELAQAKKLGFAGHGATASMAKKLERTTKAVYTRIWQFNKGEV